MPKLETGDGAEVDRRPRTTGVDQNPISSGFNLTGALIAPRTED